MWFALATAAAQAPSVQVPPLDAQLFRPSLDARRTLWVDDARRHRDHAVLARFVTHYAKDPLVYGWPDGRSTRLLSDALQLDAMAGYQLGPVRVGAVMPIHLFAAGQGRQSEAGLGDLALDLKTTLLDPDQLQGFGLAVVGRLGLPTASLDLAPLASRGPTWEATLVSEAPVGERGFWALNVGARGVPKVDLGRMVWGPRVVGRLAGGINTSAASGLAIELAGHGVLGQPVRTGVPIEGMLSGWGRSADGLTLRGGVGTSFTPGLGAPALRVAFAVSLEPVDARDTDGDGIPDARDACPDQPEDLDGVADGDGCPDPTQITVVIQGPTGQPLPGAQFQVIGTSLSGQHGGVIELPAGEHRFALSAPGHVDQEAVRATAEGPDAGLVFRLDEVPRPASLNVVATDADGAPVPGLSWRVVGQPAAYAVDEVATLAAGEHQLAVSAPGFRSELLPIALRAGDRVELPVTLRPAQAEIVGAQITIQETVFFDLDRATIQPASFGILDEVAALLHAHPELTRLLIEGHADDQGSAVHNTKLSQQRAEAVKAFFVAKGVASERLHAQGFGSERPLVPGQTPEARAKNRRVEFYVQERSP